MANIDERLTKVEADVGKIRSEAQDGFRSLNSSINNLAHDFGDRMNNLDKRIIVEKEKWGETLRKILTWGAKALILSSKARLLMKSKVFMVTHPFFFVFGILSKGYYFRIFFFLILSIIFIDNAYSFL